MEQEVAPPEFNWCRDLMKQGNYKKGRKVMKFVKATVCSGTKFKGNFSICALYLMNGWKVLVAVCSHVCNGCLFISTI